MKRAEEEWRREEDRAAAAEMVAFGFPRADATDELKRRERARRPDKETKMADIKLCRDRSPEAKALGGWFVEITQECMGQTLTHSTDWHRTPHGAVVAGLALAFNLGVTAPITEEN